MVLDHAFDVQFLGGDDAEAVDETPCRLVNEVVATVPDALVDTGNNLFGLAAFSGAANLLGEFPLGLCQSLLITAEETRVGDVLAVGQRREGFQSNVNTDLFLRRRQQFGADHAGEADEPLVADTANGAGFDRAINRAVKPNGNAANLGQVEFALLKTEAALRVGDAVVLPVALDAREARRLPGFHAAKESVKGKVNANGDVLQNLAEHTRKFRVFLLPLRERGLLLDFGRRLAQHFVVVLSPVQEAVVDLSAGFQSPRQSRLLCFRRINPVDVSQAIFTFVFRCASGFQWSVQQLPPNEPFSGTKRNSFRDTSIVPFSFGVVNDPAGFDRGS